MVIHYKEWWMVVSWWLVMASDGYSWPFTSIINHYQPKLIIIWSLWAMTNRYIFITKKPFMVAECHPTKFQGSLVNEPSHSMVFIADLPGLPTVCHTAGKDARTVSKTDLMVGAIVTLGLSKVQTTSWNEGFGFYQGNHQLITWWQTSSVTQGRGINRNPIRDDMSPRLYPLMGTLHRIDNLFVGFEILC